MDGQSSESEVSSSQGSEAPVSDVSSQPSSDSVNEDELLDMDLDGWTIPLPRAPSESLTTAFLNSLAHKPRLQLLGQYLFPVVYNFNPSQAAKITGMMLELPEREIISLVKAETHDGIEEYVLEAQRV